MKSTRFLAAALVFLSGTLAATAHAATVFFFDSSQVATPVASGATSDTISSLGYQFTYTRDKLFTGGIGMTEPIGRPVRVHWPDGIEAQAVTAGPNPSKAKITIERVDGQVFDFAAFTAKLLANTAGAGGSFEVVPFLNGEEVLPDPVVFNATGIAGNTFSYNTSPNPQGSTAALAGYDKYTIDLYVDFALIGLTFEGPALIPGDVNYDGVVDIFDVNLVSDHWGELGPLGDANVDGVVDIFDVNLISDNWTTAAASSVPEPLTLVLAAIAAAAATALSRTIPQPRATNARHLGEVR
jgi:hypothetical protein